MTEPSTRATPDPVPPQRADRREDASTAQLLTDASEQLSSLVRSEMELARAELKEAGKRAGIGGGLFGTAGVLALYGLGVLIATAVLALALAMPAWLAALIVTVVLFAAAGVAAIVGKKQVEKAPPAVQTSVQSVQKDVATVKGARS